jgi:hypothetical protein
MADWDVGTQVVCIKGFVWREMYKFLEIHPTVGQVLTIREVLKSRHGDDDLYLRFEEILNDRFLYSGEYTECCFIWTHFRPVKKTDISLLRQVATDLPDRAELEKEVKKELEDA